MTFDLSFDTIVLLVYIISVLFVIIHGFLVNNESPIAARVVWILVTIILGPFGATGYYFYGSNEYYILKRK